MSSNEKRNDEVRKYRQLVVEAIQAVEGIGARICENPDHDISLAAYVESVRRELVDVLKEADGK